jgi:hypothetical protein
MSHGDTDEVRLLAFKQFVVRGVRTGGPNCRRDALAPDFVRIGQGDEFHAFAVRENFIQTVSVIAPAAVANDGSLTCPIRFDVGRRRTVGSQGKGGGGSGEKLAPCLE